MKQLLITGAAGRIGTVMRAGLRTRYRLRLTDRVPVDDLQETERFVEADITDLEAMEQVVDGVDGILHLAGFPSTKTSWEDCFNVNMGGTYCVYDSARRLCQFEPCYRVLRARGHLYEAGYARETG
jgi:uronate dehydrogenase